MADRTWRLERQTSRLRSAVGGGGGLWADEAGRKARQRYLAPLGSAATSHSAGLTRHEDLLEEAGRAVQVSGEELRRADGHAASVAEELQRSAQDISVAYDQVHQAATAGDRCGSFLGQSAEALARAQSACADCAGPAGTARSVSGQASGAGLSAGAVADAGLTYVDLDAVDTSDNPFDDGFNYHGNDAADYEFLVAAWRDVIEPGVDAGLTREDFAAMDAEREPPLNRQVANAYDAFMGDGRIRWDRQRDGSVRVTEGRHRIAMARRMGVTRLPGEG